MTQQAFVTAAYVIAALGIGGTVFWCWATMRRAEKRAADMKR
jgi:hypothetical protein